MTAATRATGPLAPPPSPGYIAPMIALPALSPDQSDAWEAAASTLAVAGVDLVYLGLNAMLTSVSTARQVLGRPVGPERGGE